VPSARRLLLLLSLALGATVLLAWWTKARCMGGGGWTGGQQYLSWCYTDILPLWYVERLNEGAVPYRDHPVEYPVLIGLQMWLAGQVVRALVRDQSWWGVAFYQVNVALGAAAYAAAAYRMFRMGVTPARLLWFIAAPTFVVYAFMNWDATAVLLCVAAIELHRRGRDGWSGVAAGLGAAAKLFPGFLVPLVVVARLLQGRKGDAARHAGAAAGAWLAVNVPVMVTAFDGWSEFLRLNRTRPADWDSLWYLAQQVRGTPFDVTVLNLVTAGLFVAGTAIIVLMGRRVHAPQDYWRLLLPVVIWFLLTNKVYSPQFSIWLLPLLALALPRAVPFAAFAVADLFVFVLRFPFLGGRQGLTPAPDYDLFAIAIVVRAVVLVWIMVETLTLTPPELRARPSPWRSDDAAAPAPARAGV